MIYLDNAATSFPKPPAVAKAMLHYIQKVGASINRGVYAPAQEAGMTALLLRESLCRLFGHDSPAHCVLTPSFLSTVTPGQFPTCCFEPVSSLNSVVFPQLGFPASAIIMPIAFISSYFLSLYFPLKL